MRLSLFIESSPYWAKRWCTKIWLRYFRDDQRQPAWVREVLARDKRLTEQLRSTEILEDQLRQSADGWVSSLPSGRNRNDALPQPVHLLTHRVANHRHRLVHWALVASLLVATGFWFATYDAGSKSPDTLSRDFVSVPQDSNADLRPILATAQAGQVVYERVDVAIQQLATRDLACISDRFGVCTAPFTETRGNEVSRRVIQRIGKMLALLEQSAEKT